MSSYTKQNKNSGSEGPSLAINGYLLKGTLLKRFFRVIDTVYYVWGLVLSFSEEFNTLSYGIKKNQKINV